MVANPIGEIRRLLDNYSTISMVKDNVLALLDEIEMDFNRLKQDYDDDRSGEEWKDNTGYPDASNPRWDRGAM